jgi:hypothetical protein
MKCQPILHPNEPQQYIPLASPANEHQYPVCDFSGSMDTTTFGSEPNRYTFDPASLSNKNGFLYHISMITMNNQSSYRNRNSPKNPNSLNGNQKFLNKYRNSTGQSFNIPPTNFQTQNRPVAKAPPSD